MRDAVVTWVQRAAAFNCAVVLSGGTISDSELDRWDRELLPLWTALTPEERRAHGRGNSWVIQNEWRSLALSP